MKKKAYIILTTLLLLISPILYRPFKIHGLAYTDNPPFVGENYYIQSYDNEYRMIMSSSSGTFTTSGSSGNVIALGEGTMSNGKTYYSTGLTPGGVTLNGSVNINMTSSNTQIVYRVIHVDIILDSNYRGYFHYRVRSGSTTLYEDDIAVNGNVASIQWVDNSTSTTNLVFSTSISDVYLTEYNEYNWQFPIESYPAVMPLLENGYPLYDFFQHSQWLYPVFDIKSGDWIGQSYMGTSTITNFIFITDKNWSSTNAILNNIDFGTGITIQSWQYHTISSNIASGRLYNLKLSGGTGATYQFKAKSNFHFVPIFNARDTDYFSKHASLDFALNFDLDNVILSNLDKLANGDNTSASSVTSATTTNQQAQQTFTQEEQLVNNAEEDLQDNLDALDIQNQNNNLFGNSKFVASAQWVKLQFDNLTQNNAFGYMITFSLVIGLALVIVGKLRG